MKTKTKKIILTVLAVWAVLFTTDLVRVITWHRPLFCVPTIGYDDGGSGTYVGLGYWYNIKGNFMPEDDGRVTEYTMKLAGIPLLSADSN